MSPPGRPWNEHRSAQHEGRPPTGAEPAPPPSHVPTLTEVIDVPTTTDALADGISRHAVPADALPTESQLVERVLADLQDQIDVMLEYRLREVIAPLLARAADSVVRDARSELASTLRDVVARAVTQELARLRSR